MSNKADLDRLERKLDSLSDALEELNTDHVKKVLLLIHRPGWTTPAEFVFALGITEAMISQVKILQGLSGALLKGSGAVSLREQ